MHRTRCSQFPQEVYEMLIDYLSDDKASLVVCSLVCSAWTAPSQHRLFNRLVIHPPVEGTPRFTSFQTWLHRTPHICPYIKHLELSGRQLYDSTAHRPPVNASETLLHVVRMLSNLSSLRLWEVRFPGRRHTYPLQNRRPASIDLLEIEFVGDSLSTVHDLLAVIGLFDHIKTLRLIGVQLDVQGMFPEQLETELARVEFPQHTRVDSLGVALRAPTSSFVFDLFSKSANFKFLNSLDAVIEDLEDIIALGHFFRSSESTLQHLTLDPLGAIFDPRNNLAVISSQIWNEMHLRCLTTLESITFLLEMGVDGGEPRHPNDRNDDRKAARVQWRACLDMLRAIPPRSLRTVRFEVSLWEHAEEWLADSAIVEWSALDTALVQMPNLHVCALHVWRENRRPLQEERFRQCRAAVEGNLPQMRHKGVLQLTKL